MPLATLGILCSQANLTCGRMSKHHPFNLVKETKHATHP